MSNEVILFSDEEQNYIIRQLNEVRDDKKDCAYLIEARQVLRVKGFRSAIGCYWNSVVDDLREKVIHRSLDVFNKEFKEIGGKRNIKSYEDFQDHVTDHDLIECAYKMGAVSWEARKVLHQARDTRNIFDGHPKSSNPELIKVLAFISDCNKYVLNEEFPTTIIDISEYLTTMDSDKYVKNRIAVQQSMSDLPETYKQELVHRLFKSYIFSGASTILRANIEFLAPILWVELPRNIKREIGTSFDKLVQKSVKDEIELGLAFIKIVAGTMYVSTSSRRSIYEPLIRSLNESLDDWDKEAQITSELVKLGYSIPIEYLGDYVQGITLSFVGYMGNSLRWSRVDFYSDSAAPLISKMFENFDDKSVAEFVKCIKRNKDLRQRISKNSKLNRLKQLGNIILQKEVGEEQDIEFIEMMCDESRKDNFFRSLKT